MRVLGRILTAAVAIAFLLAAPPGADVQGKTVTRHRHSSHDRTCLLLQSRNAFSVVPARPSMNVTPEYQSAVAVIRERARWLAEPDARSLADRICRLSRTKGIGTDLLLAIIQAESNFRPTAVSPTGALGLMQILPSTARALAEELQIDWRGESMLRDPHMNVELGTHYFSKLLRRYDGNTVLALSAYNLGPARVDATIEQGLPLPNSYTDKVQNYRERIRTRLGPRVSPSQIPH